MKKKDFITKLVVGVAVFFLIVGLSACDEASAKQQMVIPKEMFSEHPASIAIFVDDETGVNYIVSRVNGGFAITPRYDVDGTLHVDVVKE